MRSVNRSIRDGSIDAREAQEAVASLDHWRAGWQEVSPDDAVRDMACRLVEKYPLGAADALQLAAAMVWCGGRPTAHAFLCADKRLSEAARAAGFSVIEL